MRVSHFSSGDIWAGAEKQLYTLVLELDKKPGMDVNVILMNDGELARRLESSGIKVDIIDESSHGGIAIFWKILVGRDFKEV